jgi:hypothetical protein
MENNKYISVVQRLGDVHVQRRAWRMGSLSRGALLVMSEISAQPCRMRIMRVGTRYKLVRLRR